MEIINAGLDFRSLTERSRTDMCILHHTACSVASPEDIHRWHLANGWSGAGYNLYVRKDGTVYELRPMNCVGAHAQGYNSISIGVCFEGNFEEEDMTPEQVESGKEVCDYVRSLYGDIPFKGHRDVNNTSCVPLDTELLTKNGWKQLKQIHIGEEIACPHIDDLSITFEKIDDIVPIKKQDVYTYNELTTTMDHRLIYSLEKTPNYYRIEKCAEVLKKKNARIPLAAKSKFDGLNLSDDMIKFYIAVQADGHYMIDKNTISKYIGLEFHLKKERKINRIKEILKDINLKFTECKKSAGSTSIRCYNFEGVNIVLDICEKYLENKAFTWKWLYLSENQAKLFLKEILFWDGCEVAKKYTSTVRKNLDIINAIAATHNVGSRIIGSDVFFRDTNFTEINNYNQPKRIRQKQVSCVRVPTGIILIRQNGKTFVIGNCPGANFRFDEIVYGAPAPAPTPTPEPSGEIANVQQWCCDYGYGISVDNIFGVQTKKALTKILQNEMNKQFGSGLAIDGIFGAKSKAAWRNIKQGMSGNITKAIQGFLICYGFDTNGFDGQFGSGTANAVRAYQADRGLSIDGIVGKVTISKITE